MFGVLVLTGGGASWWPPPGDMNDEPPVACKTVDIGGMVVAGILGTFGGRLPGSRMAAGACCSVVGAGGAGAGSGGCSRSLPKLVSDEMADRSDEKLFRSSSFFSTFVWKWLGCAIGLQEGGGGTGKVSMKVSCGCEIAELKRRPDTLVFRVRVRFCFGTRDSSGPTAVLC